LVKPLRSLVIVKLPSVSDRKSPRQLRCVAHVIAVVVGDDDVVELRLDSDRLHEVDDAIGITVVVASGAGVEQERLTRGGYEQRRFSALGVDEVDVQRCRRQPLCWNDRAVDDLCGWSRCL
jgi:hypothetical protein